MTKLRIYFERLWLRLRIHEVNEVIVQSQSMHRTILKNLDIFSVIMPFMSTVCNHVCHRSTQKSSYNLNQNIYDFLYVASGEPHKNHLVLIEAWKILAAKNIYPSLCLTIPMTSNPVLYKWIESQKHSYNLQIKNIGAINKEQMKSLYLQAGALIYPSILESLGLPLIEARRAGLPIIASELDYVRDIIDPEQSFDPQSPVSIARSVERFLRIEQPQISIIGANAFIMYLINSAHKQSVCNITNNPS